MICILKAVLGYVLLLFVGTNLIGLMVRSLLEASPKNAGNFVFNSGMSRPTNIIITLLIGLSASLLFLSALYYFFNTGLVIAATMIMLARLPDLFFEIKTGQKITFKALPKRPIDIVCTIIFWAALPVVWYSLCYLK